MKEADFMRLCQQRATQQGHRLWRNNVGTGWQGNVTRRHDGSLLISDPRPLHAGLMAGSSDLIGITRVKITPDMVGQTIGVFTAAEIKTPRGRVTEEQKWFIELVRNNGGMASVIRSDEDLDKLLTYQHIAR